MKRTSQAGGNAITDGPSYCIKHQVVDIKDSVRRRVNTVKGGELCEFKKEGKTEREQDGLSETAVKISTQIDAKRQKQPQITSDLKPGGMGDVDVAGTGQNPVDLFSDILQKGKRIELYVHRQRIGHYPVERRQRGNDIKVHQDQIKNERKHDGHAGQNDFFVLVMLISRIGDEKEDSNQRGQCIDHADRYQIFVCHKAAPPLR